MLDGMFIDKPSKAFSNYFSSDNLDIVPFKLERLSFIDLFVNIFSFTKAYNVLKCFYSKLFDSIVKK